MARSTAWEIDINCPEDDAAASNAISALVDSVKVLAIRLGGDVTVKERSFCAACLGPDCHNDCKEN